VPLTCGGEQVLRRDTPDVQARPADNGMLDEQNALAARTSLDARRHRRAAGADDH
jgi:hypothetical protein